ncbi:sulfatase family protein [Actomonas aquatica]|uniref:Sulfatase n=1 Tax=Actomonas aquatica TaxID=2866162 RepID=A0ABZ1C7X5_9BACT|nr:sulfatase [Opitutus sp. WL0086]WRQ86400.1 sulfatase [Opitutus sp. WL0086]
MTRPNILFCLADDAGLHFSAYGCRWVDTPGFDRVAREGLRFQHAYTPSSKCAPSRACILTGRNPWQLEAACQHQSYFPAKFTTSFEALKHAGYFTGYTQKGWAPGDPGTVDGRPRELTGTNYSAIKTTPPTNRISDNDYAANFAAFLDDRPADTPFCFWFGCVEPHRGYEYGSGIRLGGRQPSDVDDLYQIWPDNETVRTDLLDYGYEVEHFDRHLTRMLDLLEARGELDNTVVIVTSDNGMPFPMVKGQAYGYASRLPLAIRWPGGIRQPGRVIDDYVAFTDFAPTFLELADLSPAASGMQPITGRSLLPLFDSPRSGQIDPTRNHALIGKERHDVGRPDDAGYPIRGIFRDGLLYLHNFAPDRWPAGNPETGYLNCDGSPTKTAVIQSRHDPDQHHYWQWAFGKRPAEELFELATDPACTHNLADDPAFTERKTTLRTQLFAELRAQEDPRMFGHGDDFDRYPVVDEASAHFYERFQAGESLNPVWVNPTDFDSS